MRTITALALVISIAAVMSCHGQVESGTIIVVSQSQSKIVIAADSRGIDANWQPHDDQLKITVLTPKLVFAACGIVVDNSLSLASDARFVASDVAREVVRKFKPDPANSEIWGTQTQQIALQWSFEMSSRMRKGVPSRLNVWLFGNPARPLAPFVKGTFAGIEPDGSLSVVTAIVDYIPDRPGMIGPLARPYLDIRPLSDRFTWIEPMGMPQIAEQYIRGNSEFSTQIRTQMTRVADFDERIPVELVQRTIDESAPMAPGKPKGVGGKIDAVKLTRTGQVQWLCKKSVCTFPTQQANDPSTQHSAPAK